MFYFYQIIEEKVCVQSILKHLNFFRKKETPKLYTAREQQKHLWSNIFL